MKNKTLKLTFLFILILTVISMCMTSCGVVSIISAFADAYAQEEKEELPELEESKPIEVDPSPINPDDPLLNGDQNNSIENEGTSAAATTGLRSSVSIYAQFGNNGFATGSGVIYRLDANSGSAFIITNYHVVYYNSISTSISIFLFGMLGADYEIEAKYVGGSAYYDIAILHVSNSEVIKTATKNGAISAVAIANSDEVAAGHTAIAIGAPGVSEDSALSSIAVTSGIVSVDSEYITMLDVNGKSEVEFRVIRVDAAVNSGNSGGGLFDAEGRLIGIVNAKISSTDIENIAYALPSNVVRAVADNIIDYCYDKECKNVMRALMGITVQVSEMSTYYDEASNTLKTNETISVNAIQSGSISEGKFNVGDVLKSITVDGKTVAITRMHHVIDTMLDARPENKVVFEIIRGGAEASVTIDITEDCLTAY